MYDFIGDIHGHYDELIRLLKRMGYSPEGEHYKHPERKVFFVGDFIDRGPKIRETLHLVRAMVEAGQAKAVMGNHEYNAIMFHEQKAGGGHLRKHSIKNVMQHCSTMAQFKNKQAEYESFIDWFKTLPLYYQSDQFRVVHACWDSNHIQQLGGWLEKDCLSDSILATAATNGTAVYNAIEDTLKGKELRLPEGEALRDAGGFLRKNCRIKWWYSPLGKTWAEYAVSAPDGLPQEKIDTSKITNTEPYPKDAPPLFFGHYWMKGKPVLQAPNVCCLDYSVAKRGGLVAYRWQGEQELDESNFWYEAAE